MEDGRVIVIGASLGGVRALCRLVAGLPADFAAPVLVVQHVGSLPSILPSILSNAGPLEARHAVDGEPLVPGRIRIAPPDHHLLVDGASVQVMRGPKEHHTRPAIDPLFRSAALSRGADVVGVLLTGLLDDGTVGLQAIKAYGGIVVVQDPDDAEASDMPRSALRHVEVDHCLPLDEIPELLAELAGSPLLRRSTPPQVAPAVRGIEQEYEHEHDLALSKGEPIEHLKAIGSPSTFVCPDCKGSLWEVADSHPQRYRCHSGHAYTLRSLERTQALATDEALWTAIRALQEKRLLVEQLAAACRAEGDEEQARRLDAEGGQIARHTATLRQLTERVPGPTGG